MAEKSGIVFIGNKPPMSYVLAIITSLSSSNAKQITLKARGRAITTAVDAAEITRSRFPKRPKSEQNLYRNRGDASERRRKEGKNGLNNGNDPYKRVGKPCETRARAQ